MTERSPGPGWIDPGLPVLCPSPDDGGTEHPFDFVDPFNETVDRRDESESFFIQGRPGVRVGVLV